MRVLILPLLCLALAGCRQASGRENAETEPPLFAGGAGPAIPARAGVGGSDAEPIPGAETPEAARVARGVEVYKEQGCGVCHALTRAGTGGVFGPPHDGVGERSEDRIHDPNYHGRSTTVEEYLRESIVDPTAFRVPGFERTRFAMPAYTGISQDDLDALVAMLAADRGSH